MKSALVIGATRGIGRQVALTFAENGYRVCVAAKTVQSTEKTPGSVHDVVSEIESKGGTAFPIRCDVRSDTDISHTIQACYEHFGHLDAAIFNAGAIQWEKVESTTMKRFDLMNSVNSRGAFSMVSHVLPDMLKRNEGRIILVAPPIYNRFFKGKTPYAMTKVAMTVLVHGLANELDNTGVTISALWPATVVESQVTKVQSVDPSLMRTPHIFADACLAIVKDQNRDRINGKALLDEDYLRSIGIEDFRPYRCDPNIEPPRMMPREFPSLLVEEENQDLSIFSSKSKL